MISRQQVVMGVVLGETVGIAAVAVVAGSR